MGGCADPQLCTWVRLDCCTCSVGVCISGKSGAEAATRPASDVQRGGCEVYLWGLCLPGALVAVEYLCSEFPWKLIHLTAVPVGLTGGLVVHILAPAIFRTNKIHSVPGL